MADQEQPHPLEGAFVLTIERTIGGKRYAQQSVTTSAEFDASNGFVLRARAEHMIAKLAAVKPDA